MAFRDFLKGTFKIALAIFVAVLALGAVGWAILAHKDRNEKLEAKTYEIVRLWRNDLKDHLQLELVARTKLVDGQLQVALKLDGYPEYLSHPKLQARNSDAFIIVAFEDGDGFRIYEKALKLSEFSTTVDAKGNKIGLHHQFGDYLGVTKYKSFERVAVKWTLETTIPPETKVVTRPTASGDDHCAPGLAKAERLRRLAKHGVVRQTSDDAYTVGYREVTFYSQYLGGGLLTCR
jgi:hypothetical protein